MQASLRFRRNEIGDMRYTFLKASLLTIIGAQIATATAATTQLEACELPEIKIDGCSDEGYNDFVVWRADFEKSCRKHDYCYRTIGPTKRECDSAFWKNMNRQCDDAVYQIDGWRSILSVGNPISHKVCRADAGAAYYAVRELIEQETYPNRQFKIATYLAQIADKYIDSGIDCAVDSRQ